MNEIVKKKYFLYIKIMDNFYKDDILMALESADISKASMMEGINLDNALTRNLEIFKGFFSEQVQEEKKICRETDKIREIVKGGLPTSEGDIPIYDEVIKSPEFSELAMEDEALTEKVKRSETDGEAHKTQEKIIDEK